MVFSMVDAIVRSKGKRGAAMLDGYRGYLIMTPRDLFPSIAQHRVQAVLPTPLVPHPGMPPQMMPMPGWPPFMWGAMLSWMPPPQVAPGQAPSPGMLPPHYIHPVPPTPQPPVSVPVPVPVPLKVKVESSPVVTRGGRGQGPSFEGAEKLFDSLITSSLMAKQVPPPPNEVSPAPAQKAEAGGDAALETPKDARPERRLAPAPPSPTRHRPRGVRGSHRSGSRSRSPAEAGSRRQRPRSASRSKSRSRSPAREREGGRERGGWGRYGPQPVAEGRQRSEPRRGDREGRASPARRTRSPEARLRRESDGGRERHPYTDTVIQELQGRSCYNGKVRRRIRLRDAGPSSTWPYLCVCHCASRNAGRSRPVIAVPVFTPVTSTSCHASASSSLTASLSPPPAASPTTRTSSATFGFDRR
jgi:hypothetical protein